MSQFQPWGLLLGRLLLAYIFVLAGYDKVVGFARYTGYMAKYAMPMVEPLLVATIALELVAGLMLVVGWKARWAALALLLFTLAASVIFHAYWAVAPEQAYGQMLHFQKNLAIMGGMLYVALMGPGRFSLDKA